ncbi:MAG: hypothetical protein Q4B60_05915 [Erysipelotrichaceae bacterium]|nr:hypothetical protein [Erysipelotrichaceae bacterium]
MKYTVIAAFVVLALLIALVIKFLKKSQYQKIVLAIQSKNHDAFKELCEDKMTKFLFPEAHLDTLRLNEAMLRNYVVDIEKYLEKLDKYKLSEKDKEKIYSQAYNYYLSVKDTVRCKKWYEKIQGLKNDRLKAEVDKSYNIYIEKGYKYLEDMLSDLEDMEPQNRGVNEFLISLMYENKGDHKNAKVYKKLAEEHMKMFDEQNSK